jgi:hypothetical protein
MSPVQITPKPYYSIGDYAFFKQIFDENPTDDDDNFELFLKYINKICKRRKDIDGLILSTGVYFDDSVVLFKCEAEMYQFKYYLFPIRRIDAYLIMNRLAFMIHEHMDEYKLSVKYEPRKPFSDKYDNDESVRITIRDESIPNWKRKLKSTLSKTRSKSIYFINNVLPGPIRIVLSRKNFMFDWKYKMRFLPFI